MLRFFRRIRQKLFLEGRVSKYLGYAFGEVLLIVVGILIALQINDWNEGRKQNIEVRLFLSDIHRDLVKEGNILKDRSEELDSKLIAMENLIRYFEKADITKKAVERYFGEFTGFPWFQPIASAYESLKSSGLPLSNEILKTKLINYFEDKQGLLESTTATYEFNYKTHWLPFMRKHFQFFTFMEPVVIREPPDPDLAKDFLTETNYLSTMTKLTGDRVKELLDLNTELADLIDAELSH